MKKCYMNNFKLSIGLGIVSVAALPGCTPKSTTGENKLNIVLIFVDDMIEILHALGQQVTIYQILTGWRFRDEVH